MNRKTFAVCVNGYDWEYETRVVDGIYNECQKRDINLLVFAGLTRKPEEDCIGTISQYVLKGEDELFELINYELVDGVIIIGQSLVDQSQVDRIIKRAAEKHVLSLNINDPVHKADINVELSEENAMELVMRHLVYDHGLKTINFMGGFPGNRETEERLDAYRRVLTEAGITVDENRIGYGGFWIGAKECAEQFMKADEKPEAIVCANDTMAFFTMDYLKDNGYRVPEDIVVTGFDGVADCELYSPSLTTVRRNYSTAGHRAVEAICEALETGNISEKVLIQPELIKNHSCGCPEPELQEKKMSFIDKYTVRNSFTEFNSYLQKMNTVFSQATTTDELYSCATEGVEFFGYSRFFICACTGLEKTDRLLKEYENGEKNYGMTDRVQTMIQFGTNVRTGTMFKTSRILPIDILHDEKPCFFAFSPMYFKDRFLGYMAYEPTGTHGLKGDMFATWVMQISNNAGSFYMNNELKYVAMKLEDTNSRDPLTGLYNRRGVIKSKKIMERAISSHSLMTCVVADVDDLKKINDEFGHEGGDVVIKQAAMALGFSLPQDAISMRTGGDEFCAFFMHDDSLDMQNIIYSIDQHLENFNNHSGLPYRASCSCGYVTKRPVNMNDFDLMMKEADDNMYAVKIEKKAGR